MRCWEAVGEDGPPVLPVTDPAGGAHLLVTTHELIRRILADPHTFRPDNALDAVTPIPVAALRILARHGFRLPSTLANNGGDDHPAIRAIVADALHPNRVDAQRPWLTDVVRRRVGRLAADLRAGRQADLYGGLAADLPLRVLARLIDLPDSHAAAVKEFSRAALELFWAPLDPERQRVLAEIVGRYHAVLRDFAATAPGTVGRLRQHAGNPDTAVGALFFLLVAGQETTSQFLTLLLHRLAGEPGVLAGLAAGSLRAADVVEEGLRLIPPIVTWRRVAAHDTNLAGMPVPAGASLVLWPGPAATRWWWPRRTSSAPASAARAVTWRSARARTAASARNSPGWRRPSLCKRPPGCCTTRTSYAPRTARKTCRSACPTR
jgi:cytochrome P450